jgi:DNA-binding CsgD family transcriptional regulator
VTTALAETSLVSALVVALDQLGSPAFVTDGRGRPVFSNTLGAKLFDRDPDGITRNLRRRISPPAVDVREIRAPGHRSHWLVVLGPSNDHSPDRLTKATELWKLTRRQVEVLRLAMTGDANKIIADKLSCAEVTIEFHMTALFRKAGVESRAQLVSRFWTL